MCSSFFVFWAAMYTTFLLIILLLSIKKSLFFTWESLILVLRLGEGKMWGGI